MAVDKTQPSQTLMNLLNKLTSQEPVMWGPSIVEYGCYPWQTTLHLPRLRTPGPERTTLQAWRTLPLKTCFPSQSETSSATPIY